VGTQKIANAAVTNDKIADGAVSYDKLDQGLQNQLATIGQLPAIDDHLSNLDGAVAMTMALATVPMAPSKEFSLGFALGGYNGEYGYAAKLNWVVSDNFVVSGGFTSDSRQQFSGTAGFAIGW
jgi:hypothetical protein